MELGMGGGDEDGDGIGNCLFCLAPWSTKTALPQQPTVNTAQR